jgi:hypothetical protein
MFILGNSNSLFIYYIANTQLSKNMVNPVCSFAYYAYYVQSVHLSARTKQLGNPRWIFMKFDTGKLTPPPTKLLSNLNSYLDPIILKTYTHFCAYLGHNSLNTYQSKCFKPELVYLCFSLLTYLFPPFISR